MAGGTFRVTCSVDDAARAMYAHMQRSISASCLDDYTIHAEGGGVCRLIVFEKYYARAGNRLTLSVQIDDLEGATRVHSIGGGGGEGVFFRFDWGASESFANAPYEALRGYMRE